MKKLTRKKLLFFEEIFQLIEKRATVCLNYIYRVQNPSVHTEEFESMEVGNERFPGMTTTKRWVRGEYNYLTFPTDCLYDEDALIRYREEREKNEIIKNEAVKAQETQREIQQLKRLVEKYPQFVKTE